MEREGSNIIDIIRLLIEAAFEGEKEAIVIIGVVLFIIAILTMITFARIKASASVANVMINAASDFTSERNKIKQIALENENKALENENIRLSSRKIVRCEFCGKEQKFREGTCKYCGGSLKLLQ